MGSRVAYFEAGARDNAALKRFYTELFGWTLRDLGEGYSLVDTGASGGVNGGIGRSGDGTPWATFYVSVPDLKETLDRVAAEGGRTIVEPLEIPNFGAFAMFADMDGNLVGLVRGDGSALGAPGGDGGVPVDWFEVLGSDAERTQRFYADLFGWKVDESGFPGYRLVDTGSGEDSIGGGLGASEEGHRWATVYAHVDDVDAALAKAEELGGSRVYGPNAVDDHMRTGALRDPAGNVFGVYEHKH